LVQTLRSNRLVQLRERIEQALLDPRDAAFEEVVQHCRDARIQDSKAVKARLKAIDQPRTVLAELAAAVHVASLDAGKLRKALSAAQSPDCPSRSVSSFSSSLHLVQNNISAPQLRPAK
jgi:hypothetical protein